MDSSSTLLPPVPIPSFSRNTPFSTSYMSVSLPTILSTTENSDTEIDSDENVSIPSIISKTNYSSKSRKLYRNRHKSEKQSAASTPTSTESENEKEKNTQGLTESDRSFDQLLQKIEEDEEEEEEEEKKKETKSSTPSSSEDEEETSSSEDKKTSTVDNGKESLPQSESVSGQTNTHDIEAKLKQKRTLAVMRDNNKSSMSTDSSLSKSKSKPKKQAMQSWESVANLVHQ